MCSIIYDVTIGVKTDFVNCISLNTVLNLIVIIIFGLVPFRNIHSIFLVRNHHDLEIDCHIWSSAFAIPVLLSNISTVSDIGMNKPLLPNLYLERNCKLSRRQLELCCAGV